jgi:ligand-binding sensor domain-containing protein
MSVRPSACNRKQSTWLISNKRGIVYLHYPESFWLSLNNLKGLLTLHSRFATNMKTETDPISETLCSKKKVAYTMDTLNILSTLCCQHKNTNIKYTRKTETKAST